MGTPGSASCGPDGWPAHGGVCGGPSRPGLCHPWGQGQPPDLVPAHRHDDALLLL